MKLPQGWKEVKLNELELIAFKGVNTDKDEGGEHYLIPSGAVFPEIIKKDKCYKIKKESFDKISKEKILVEGDILFNTGGVGTLGRSAFFSKSYFNEKCVSDAFVLIIRNLDKKLSSKYLFYYLQTDYIKKNIIKQTVGSTGIKSIKSKDILNFKICLPPLSVQNNIIETLEKIEKIKIYRDESNKFTKAYLDSIFYNMFGNLEKNSKNWKLGLLKDLIIEFRYGTSNKSGLDGYLTLGIPNIIGEKINTIKINKVEVTLEEFERLRLKNGDVLFVRTNGNPNYIGRCNVFDLDDKNIIYASYLIRCRLKKDLNPIFLKFFLETSYGKSLMKSKCKTTAGQYNINTQGLGNLNIIVPPLEKQIEFIEIFNKFKNLKNKQSQSKKHIEEIFNSLMHKAFTGELR